MSESRRFERLHSLLNEVIHRPGLHPAELAGELGVSERTLRRDLAELRGLGFDLEWADGYQLQEKLDLEGAAASAGGSLTVLYEQQLRLLRALHPDLSVDVQAEVEAQAPQLLAVLFQQAIERALAAQAAAQLRSEAAAEPARAM